MHFKIDKRNAHRLIVQVEYVAFEEGIVAKLDRHIVGRLFKVGPENVCFCNKEIQLVN